MQGCINNVRLFADDTLLYLTVQNNNDAELLQHDLDGLWRDNEVLLYSSILYHFRVIWH